VTLEAYPSRQNRGGGSCHQLGAVPVLYLDQGFPADLADRSFRFSQINGEFDDSDRPTPTASTT